jgi:hypothetical protein
MLRLTAPQRVRLVRLTFLHYNSDVRETLLILDRDTYSNLSKDTLRLYNKNMRSKSLNPARLTASIYLVLYESIIINVFIVQHSINSLRIFKGDFFFNFKLILLTTISFQIPLNATELTT